MEAVNLKLIKQEKITNPKTPEALTFQVLENLFKPVEPTAVYATEQWFLQTEAYLRLYLTTSVLEFTVLNLMHQKNYFKNFQMASAETRLMNALTISRLLLTEKNSDDVTARLPKSVLAQTNRDGLVFYQSIFHKEGEILPLRKTLSLIFTNYIPRWKDLFLLSIVAIALYLSPLLLELVIGLFVGYTFSSLMEYYVHQNIGHAGPRIKKLFKKWGSFGSDMLNFNLEHSIHHGSVSVNYANPFAPNNLESAADYVTQVQNRQRIDDMVFKRGGKRLAGMIVNSHYGLRSSNMWRTHLFFMPISLLVLILIEILFSNYTSLAFSIGFLFLSTFWITASSVYHPCLHYTEEKIKKELNPLLRWFMYTRLSRFIALSHRMHHAHGGEVNQNLNIGYDYLFAWAPITTTELIDLKNKKTIY